MEHYYKVAMSIIEKVLAVVILIGLIFFLVERVGFYDITNLSSADSFENLISDALLLILGLELVRLLIAPSIKATLELLIFVVARKTLSPGVTAQDLLMTIVAFSLLILISQVFVPEGSFGKLGQLYSNSKKRK